MALPRPGTPDFPPHAHRHIFHHDDHRRGIPPLPDLSFERTYLKSIKRHIHSEGLGADQGLGELTVTQRRAAENIRIDWGKVALVTLRDQIFMPFLQGAVWGLTTIYLIPRVASIRRAFSLWWRRGNLIGVGRKTEGEGIGALRNWLSSLTANHSHKPAVAPPRHVV